MANETTLTVIGNLTGAPELRYTQGGLAVANFTVASTPRTFDRQANDWKDGEPLFLRCSIWREAAEHVAASLSKGSRVIVVGSLKQRSYETKEGEKRTSLELEVEEVGPALRYATATVTRAGGSGGSRQGGSTHSGGSNGSRGASGAPAPSGDVWATPGAYNDETPY